MQNSMDPMHQKLWGKLDKTSSFPSLGYGVNKILGEEGSATGILMESTYADHFVSKHCPRYLFAFSESFQFEVLALLGKHTN